MSCSVKNLGGGTKKLGTFAHGTNWTEVYDAIKGYNGYTFVYTGGMYRMIFVPAEIIEDMNNTTGNITIDFGQNYADQTLYVGVVSGNPKTLSVSGTISGTKQITIYAIA